MPTSSLNRRKEGRPSKFDSIHPVSFLIRTEKTQYQVDLVNYHHKGACLRIPQTAKDLLSESALNKAKIDFYLGNQCIKTAIPFRIAWDSISQDGLVGIEFVNPISSYMPRAQRFDAHPNYSPMLSARDPLDPHRVIFFKVVNFSVGGMLVSSSLSNKHLFAGMKLVGAKLSLPGQKTLEIDVAIQNTRRATDDSSFLLGISVSSERTAFLKAIRSYASVLSPDSDDRVESLSQNGMLDKGLKQALTFRIVDSPQEYEQVLKLRFSAYAAHGKVKDGTSWESQGEGLDNEGVIIGGWMGGQLVATFEIRYGNSSLPLRNYQLFRTARFEIDFDRCAEINKLAIHPNAHGSDLVVGMIQKAHAMLIARGNFNCLILATDRLLPIYKRVGFRKLDITVSHPVLQNMVLHAMYLENSVYLRARQIHAHYWNVLFRETQKLMSDIGVVKPVHLSLLQRIQAKLMSVLIVVLKYFRRSGVSKKPPATPMIVIPNLKKETGLDEKVAS